jgi:hypothetical protein
MPGHLKSKLPSIWTFFFVSPIFAETLTVPATCALSNALISTVPLKSES